MTDATIKPDPGAPIAGAKGPSTVGAVAIGRNEGERLRLCLESLIPHYREVVYVDSGSTDGSAELARDLGVHVIVLEDGPYTAARGRQVGFEELRRLAEDLRYVQFIDGDCVLDADWPVVAIAYLDEDPKAAAVSGRRREERPDVSFLSRLIDVDWNVPSGLSDVLGGDSLIRLEALVSVGGWCTELIAGEDPELAFRFIDHGWRIMRLDAEMTSHDIAMTRFGQYWKRSIRTGHAYAEVAMLRGSGAGRRWIRRVLNILFYGLAMPILFLAFLPLFWPASVFIVFVYSFQCARVVRWRRMQGDPLVFSVLYSCINTLCKLAQAIGVLKYAVERLTGRSVAIIEYKPRPS